MDRRLRGRRQPRGRHRPRQHSRDAAWHHCPRQLAPGGRNPPDPAEQLRLNDAAASGVPATVRHYLLHGHDALLALQLPDGTRVTAGILDQPTHYPPGTHVRLTVRGTAYVLPGPAPSR
ncbi:TOBE domain-containing protein [Micromonospora coerulea]|uniref:TOBE domain-containing protein n=1 Tax=Micromonospora coerulea TaxID=47856 RepID=UPI003D15BE93